MEAAIGWQSNSGHSEEGRVPGQKWIAAAYGGAVAFRGKRGRLCFPADSGCTTGSSFSALSDAPTLMTGSP